MGMQMPSQAQWLLTELGYHWPMSDETALAGLAGVWDSFSARLTGPLSDADVSAAQVWSDSQGAAIDAFRETWTDPQSARGNLADAAVATTIVGVGLNVCAGVVTALKINTLIQLALLAIEIEQAIATAIVTGGASLLELPLFRAGTKLLLDELQTLAMNAVLGG
jgi:hypothetical protein